METSCVDMKQWILTAESEEMKEGPTVQAERQFVHVRLPSEACACCEQCGSGGRRGGFWLGACSAEPVGRSEARAKAFDVVHVFDGARFAVQGPWVGSYAQSKAYVVDSDNAAAHRT